MLSSLASVSEKTLLWLPIPTIPFFDFIKQDFVSSIHSQLIAYMRDILPSSRRETAKQKVTDGTLCWAPSLASDKVEPAVLWHSRHCARKVFVARLQPH